MRILHAGLHFSTPSNLNPKPPEPHTGRMRRACFLVMAAVVVVVLLATLGLAFLGGYFQT